MALGEAGVLKKYNVELIGASLEAIDRGEDRELFKKVVEEAGAESARSDIAHSIEEVDKIAEKFGYPLVVRPSFTMGGLGSGIAHDEEELHRIAGAGIHYSPTDEVLIEEGIEGWKEYELELMRDKKDNVVVVCPIENVDPVGVHTGDSITVAPVFTLTDREYQKLRDIGIAIIRGVGVDTGGCNIQFAINPNTGRIIVIEMNRVCPVPPLWHPRRPASRLRRSPPSWLLATRSTKSRTISRSPLRPASSRPSTTWSPRSRVSPSKSSRVPIRR